MFHEFAVQTSSNHPVSICFGCFSTFSFSPKKNLWILPFLPSAKPRLIQILQLHIASWGNWKPSWNRSSVREWVVYNIPTIVDRFCQETLSSHMLHVVNIYLTILAISPVNVAIFNLIFGK